MLQILPFNRFIIVVLGAWQVFGQQVKHDSEYDRPDVLPFSTYAACRLLDTTPADPVCCCPSSSGKAHQQSFVTQLCL